jgi:hypothetical protein
MALRRGQTMNVNHNKKGNNMRSIYIKRRIAVLVIPMVLALAVWSGPTKAPINVFAKVYAVLTEPTFVCEEAEVLLEDQMLWDIADKYCSGNITDANNYIMKNNGIKGKDLRDLLPSTIIVIKGGN